MTVILRPSGFRHPLLANNIPAKIQPTADKLGFTEIDMTGTGAPMIVVLLFFPERIVGTFKARGKLPRALDWGSRSACILSVERRSPLRRPAQKRSRRLGNFCDPMRVRAAANRRA